MAGKAQKRNIGGGTWYSGGSSNVASEAKERKRGGQVTFKRKDGGEVSFRAYGGRSVGKHSGLKTGGRLDKRARGGALKRATGGGADKSPFSSAGAGMRHKAGGAVKKGA